ncbi:MULTISPECIES: hypothetical protein [Kaistia]|uniref:Uncharacterized protein n=1 Tax=Kaistia nematophila TaxID=2994654 RepID=A0A9X3INH3_9HYPH|nr:hypothetical protein [Kaistia nematophila]MBN9026793.1 hypothetical protein [Hyphomicrobiales bacterium]MCX5570935.1 hypothetical protein [Kaistia nematophila]
MVIWDLLLEAPAPPVAAPMTIGRDDAEKGSRAATLFLKFFRDRPKTMLLLRFSAFEAVWA